MTVKHDKSCPGIEYKVDPILLREMTQVLGGKTYVNVTTQESLGRILGKVQRMVQNIVRGAHRDTVVRWDVSGVGTDHSFIVKGKQWQVALNPARIVYPSLREGMTETVKMIASGGAASPTVNYKVTVGNIESIVGAAIHEVAHVLYSGDALEKDFDKLDEDTIAVFRVWEDIYVNARMLYERLPAAYPFLQNAYNWTNSLETLQEAMQNPVRSFTDVVMNVCGIVLMGEIINRSDVTIADKLWANLADAVRPVAAPLEEGDEIPWNARLQIYRDIEAALKQAMPTKMREEMERDKRAREAFGKEKVGGAGNGMPINCSGGVRPGEQDGTPTIAVSSGVTGAGTTANHKAAAAEADGIDLDSLGKPKGSKGNANPGQGGGAGQNVDETVNYDRAEPNEYPDFVPNPRTVEKLRNAFRIRSNVRRMSKHGAPEGRLSMRRLHKVLRPVSSQYIFKERPIVRGEAAVVLFLVDSSGSMSSMAGGGKTHYQVAVQAASELWHALRSNPDYKLYFWGFSSHRGGLDIRAAIVEHGKLHLPRMIDGGTPTHLAVSEAAKFLQQNHPDAKKLVVHFTDCDLTMNKPSDWEAVMADELTRVATVTTVGGGSADRFRAQAPYLNISVHSADDLPMAVQEICVRMD